MPFLDLKSLVMMRERSVHSVVRCLFCTTCFLSSPCSQLRPAEQGSLGGVGICIEQLTAIKYLSKTLCKVRQMLLFVCYSKVEHMFRFGAVLPQTEKSGEKSRETREGSWTSLNSVTGSVNGMCLKRLTSISSNQLHGQHKVASYDLILAV